MGHCNTSCLISGLSIGSKKVLCTILAPTKSKNEFADLRTAENKLFYPLTMPFVGEYSPDEISLESYEANPWIDNLVNHFRTGVIKSKQKKFDALALLECINDKVGDEDYGRSKWFDIKNPNELCELTKTLELAYIDYEVFKELFNSDDEKEAKAVAERCVRQAMTSLKILKEDRKNKEEDVYWQMFRLQDGCHDLFLKFNENLLREFLEGKKKKAKELTAYVEPMDNWITVFSWLFNLGRPWTPPTWSHQDGEDENIIKLAKIILKVTKD